MKRLSIAILVLVAACASGPRLTASVISTANTIGVGEQRILVEFSDDLVEGVTAVLRDENGSPLDEDEGELVELVRNERFAYAFYLTIPEPETYQLTFDYGREDAGPVGFVAVEDPVQVTVGEDAPSRLAGVMLFASPTLCPSGTCESMDDIVDDVTMGNYLRIEVFIDPEAEEPDLSPEVEAWGIPGQPWLYVVAAGGRVTAVFEGGVGRSELEKALAPG